MNNQNKLIWSAFGPNICANFQRNFEGCRFSFVDWAWNDRNRTWPGFESEFLPLFEFLSVVSTGLCQWSPNSNDIFHTFMIGHLANKQLANFQNGSCAQWCKQSPKSLTTNCHLPGRGEKNGTQRRTTWCKHRSCCGSLRGLPQDEEIKLVALQSIKQGFRNIGTLTNTVTAKLSLSKYSTHTYACTHQTRTNRHTYTHMYWQTQVQTDKPQMSSVQSIW